MLARSAPGATTLRVKLHRWRGVHIARGVWIGYDVIIETSHPHLVTIREGAALGIRSTIIAHNREQRGVVIEEDAAIGAGAIILPNVTIGRGAIVTAGSVVTNRTAIWIHLASAVSVRQPAVATKVCPRCGAKVRKAGVRGMDSYLCPRCQPETRPGLVDWRKTGV